MLRQKGRKKIGNTRANTAIIAAMVGLPAVGLAQSTYVYVGSNGGEWSVPENWTPVTPPGPPSNGDDAVVSESSSSLFTVNLDYTGYTTSNALANVTLDCTGSGGIELDQNTSTASVYAANETVGFSGAATYSQSVATNSLSGNLYLGYNSTASGNYLISGTGTFTDAGVGYVGYSGTGSFTQNGGTVSFSEADGNGGSLNLGESAGAHGTYSLISGTLTGYEVENQGAEILGVDGVGTFSQSGGTNNAGAIIVGLYSDSSGTYSLSAGNLTMTNYGDPTHFASLTIDNLGGTGEFIQSGGTVSITGADSSNPSDASGLFVGFSTGPGTASYTLSGSGTLTDTLGVYLGLYGGTGTFDQTGGTATFSGDGGGYGNNLALAVGGNNISMPLDGTGFYNLSGGTLDVLNNEAVGAFGTGTFTQNGGMHSIGAGDNLYIGTGSGVGLYDLSGTGTLTVGGGMYVGGDSSSAGGTGTFNVGGGQATIEGTFEIWNTTGTSVAISGGMVTAGNTVNQATITQTGGTSNLGPLTGGGNIVVGNSSGVAATMTVSAIQQNSVTVNSTGSITITGGSANTISSLLNNGTTNIEASATLSSLTGTGTLALSSASGTSTVKLANNSGLATQGSLTIATNSALDIANNHIIISYTSGTQATVDANIRSYLISGRAGGTWAGTSGINSSVAALSANSHYAIGYADGADHVVAGLSSGQIEVKYTLLGDADLDGAVTGSDFTALVGNLGKSGRVWDQGDFDYDGAVTGSDFTDLVGNLGKSASGAAVDIPAADCVAIDAFAAANGLMADVPEPASASVIVLAGLGILGGRMRRRQNSFN